MFQKFANIKFHEIRPAGAEFFHADGQTYMTKLRVAFRKFENAPTDVNRIPKHDAVNYNLSAVISRDKLPQALMKGHVLMA